MPFNARQAGVAQWTRPRKFFGTINHVSRWVFELGRSTSPRLIAKLFKASLSPRRGFTFGPWLAEPNVLKSDFNTLVRLEARAVTKSESEAERLRAHARRFLDLAHAIAEQEASRALQAYAPELLDRADALKRKDEN